MVTGFGAVQINRALHFPAVVSGFLTEIFVAIVSESFTERLALHRCNWRNYFRQPVEQPLGVSNSGTGSVYHL
jgi:hypothetical protein